jgi:Rrf2 family nitric oxide-sensitive transcriptional repressor
MLVLGVQVRNNFAVHLSRRTDFSFRLLILLGVDADRTVSVGDAARRLGVSSNHLAKIAQELAAAGIVETVRGRSGGVRLTAEGLATTVGDVVRALEPLDLVECSDAARNECRLTPACRLAEILEQGMDAFLDTLDGCTVADLCAKPTRLRRLLA